MEGGGGGTAPMQKIDRGLFWGEPKHHLHPGLSRDPLGSCESRELPFFGSFKGERERPLLWGNGRDVRFLLAAGPGPCFKALRYWLQLIDRKTSPRSLHGRKGMCLLATCMFSHLWLKEMLLDFPFDVFSLE